MGTGSIAVSVVVSIVEVAVKKEAKGRLLPVLLLLPRYEHKRAADAIEVVAGCLWVRVPCCTTKEDTLGIVATPFVTKAAVRQDKQAIAIVVAVYSTALVDDVDDLDDDDAHLLDLRIIVEYLFLLLCWLVCLVVLMMILRSCRSSYYCRRIEKMLNSENRSARARHLLV